MRTRRLHLGVGPRRVACALPGYLLFLERRLALQFTVVALRPRVVRDEHLVLDDCVQVARFEPDVAVAFVEPFCVVAHCIEVVPQVVPRRVRVLLETRAHIAQRNWPLDYHVVVRVLPPARQAEKWLD